MKIKELRKKSGMTQKEFADYLKIPKRSIENWEYRKTEPPLYIIELIEYKLKNEGLI